MNTAIIGSQNKRAPIFAISQADSAFLKIFVGVIYLPLSPISRLMARQVGLEPTSTIPVTLLSVRSGGRY